MNDLEVIRGWTAEVLAAVEEEGAVAALILIHYAAGGSQEVELHAMRPNSPQWGNADAMAETLDRIARRHSAGLPGTQTFQLVALFGTQTKPTRLLPFSRAGMLAVVGGTTAAGGLLSEPPTTSGLAATAQRWGELAISGASAERLAVLGALAKLVENLATNNQTLLERNMQFALDVQKLVADQSAVKADMAVKVVNAKRNAELANQALRLAPAAINGALGKEIFPQAAASVAVLRGLSKTLNREQVAHLASLAAGDLGNQAALAALMDQLTTIREQDEADAAKVRELTKDLHGDGSYESGEFDAAGEVVPLTEAPALDHRSPATSTKQLAEQTNGHANGTEDTKLIDALFATVPKGQMTVLIGALSGRDKGLADRLKARAKHVGRED